MNKILLILTTIIYILSIFIRYPELQKLLGFKKTISEIFDNFYILITPVDITFEIWGLIYWIGIILLGYWWYLIIFNPDETEFQLHKKVIVYFNIITIINSLWIIVWLQENIFISWLILLILLVLLIRVNKIIDNQNNKKMFFDKTFYSIYLPWVCILFTINTAILLTINSIGNTTLFTIIIASIIVLIIMLMACYFLLIKKNMAFMLVILWSLLGIYMNDISESTYKFNRIVGMMCVILVVCIIYYIISDFNDNQQE